jgi:dihydroxyacid dehydratase/phosphogluconate dehydratase
MNCLMEVLGLALPYNGTALADSSLVIEPSLKAPTASNIDDRVKAFP